METDQRSNRQDRPRPLTKNIVVVFDGDISGINDIINMIVNPRKVKAGRPKVSAIGFADALQLRRIVDILNDSGVLPQ